MNRKRCLESWGGLMCLLVGPVYLVGLVGCGEGLKKFPVAQAKGVVLCKGKPVAGAMVFFEPIKSGDSAIIGKPGFADTNENGEFELSTYGRQDGAVVGKHRVRVARPSELPGFTCDCELSDTKDVTQVTVQEGEVNEFTIELPEQKRKKRGDPGLSEEELEELEDQ